MVTTTLDDVIYVSTTRRIKSKRILTWKERLYRLRDAGHLKDAIRLALLFYRNEAPGKGFYVFSILQSSVVNKIYRF